MDEDECFPRGKLPKVHSATSNKKVHVDKSDNLFKEVSFI